MPLLWPALLGAAFGLQPPGEFHGDEPVARDGERWLALRVDGRLDLVFDTTDHYNLLRPTLFLSSRAAAGELVGQVAQYQSVGC
ncbi:hypothetical protein [Aerolutibacter ruishenii]|uniref:hypothetical protein n=1 Tax=Aerolutibacter ruishenii TaxID=686800 RepID=UPI0013156D62|nr:hypothetical protein [Lysobacter ruishenii]